MDEIETVEEADPEEMKEDMRKELYRDKVAPKQFEAMYGDSMDEPFQNQYWDHKEEGVYASAASGRHLFSSKRKFDAGIGIPAFTHAVPGAPLEEDLCADGDETWFRLTCSADGAFLGHVFNYQFFINRNIKNGADPGKDDLKKHFYCVNSLALKFIPLSELTEEEQVRYGFREGEEPVSRGREPGNKLKVENIRGSAWDKFRSTCPRGAHVKLHYTGTFEDGEIFDKTDHEMRDHKPAEFQVGVGEVIKGWDEGLL